MVDHNFFGQSHYAALCEEDPKIAWQAINDDTILCTKCNSAFEIGTAFEEKCSADVHEFVDNQMLELGPDHPLVKWQKRNPHLRICGKCNTSIAYGQRSTCERFVPPSTERSAPSLSQSLSTVRGERAAVMLATPIWKTPPPKTEEVYIKFGFMLCLLLFT
jgi:uncharacterized protein with PIN domain